MSTLLRKEGAEKSVYFLSMDKDFQEIMVIYVFSVTLITSILSNSA